MAISIKCGACGGTIRSESMPTTKLVCPHCQATLGVPRSAAPAAQPATPALAMSAVAAAPTAVASPPRAMAVAPAAVAAVPSFVPPPAAISVANAPEMPPVVQVPRQTLSKRLKNNHSGRDALMMIGGCGAMIAALFALLYLMLQVTEPVTPAPGEPAAQHGAAKPGTANHGAAKATPPRASAVPAGEPSE